MGTATAVLALSVTAHLREVAGGHPRRPAHLTCASLSLPLQRFGFRPTTRVHIHPDQARIGGHSVWSRNVERDSGGYGIGCCGGSGVGCDRGGGGGSSDGMVWVVAASSAAAAVMAAAEAAVD